MIYHTPQLGSEISIIEDVENIRARLRHALSTPNRWAGVLRRNTFARAIQGSNSIEGFNVTTEDAVAAIESETPLDTTEDTWHEITGYRDAMTYVLQLATDPHFKYSDALIKSLHFMMLKHDLKKHPGTWRPGSIYIRDERRGITVYEGPPVDAVPDLVATLMDSLNEVSTAPTMVRAAMAHFNLVMIHPFSDGNGRMARVLQTLVLAREGILDPRFSSIEEYLGRNTREYYDILAQVGGGAWTPGNDARAWVQFCLIAHFNQATTLLRRTRETERVWNELEALVEQRRLPARATFALSDATFGYRVRNSSYRTAADINDTLASRDLKQLVDSGLLISTGDKRGRIYTGSETLKAIRERNREPRALYKDPMPGNMFP